jgi:hypothetical protein
MGKKDGFSLVLVNFVTTPQEREQTEHFEVISLPLGESYLHCGAHGSWGRWCLYESMRGGMGDVPCFSTKIPQNIGYILYKRRFGNIWNQKEMEQN